VTLSLTGVGRAFAGVVAVNAVTLDVVPGRVLAVLGPNGAGKTSVVNIACGSVLPDTGTVSVDGRDLTGSGPRQFAAAGVVRTFQSLRLFDSMTVLDNVLVGGHGSRRLPLAAALLRSPGFRRAEQALRDRAAASLDVVGMAWAADRPVTALSHGQRRRVELARALSGEPAYVVLDEPGAGLDPEAVSALAETLRALVHGGLGLLLVEHDAGLVERVADECLAMVAGEVVAAGSYAEVSRQANIAAQLGAG
jgi:branched-chain amino acid transport system ATP-binding protein